MSRTITTNVQWFPAASDTLFAALVKVWPIPPVRFGPIRRVSRVRWSVADIGHQTGKRSANPYDRCVRITRCPRCLAEDVTADAHPSRRLLDGVPATFFVCRECFRAAELEFQIAAESSNLPYARLPIRESLRLLRGFYQDRQREAPDDARVTAALQEVERRLLIGPVGRTSKLDA